MKKIRDILLAIAATLIISVIITGIVGNTVEGYFEDTEKVEYEFDANEYISDTKRKLKDSKMNSELSELKQIIEDIIGD